MSVLAQIDAVNARLDVLERSVLTYRQGLAAEYERLVHEVEVHKKLARYARRTWFEMMAYIFIIGLLVSDVAREYADNQWWSLFFWTTQHGDGGASEWVLRIIGLVSQASLLFVLGRRSQVPDWIFDRTPFAEEQRIQRRRSGSA